MHVLWRHVLEPLYREFLRWIVRYLRRQSELQMNPTEMAKSLESLTRIAASIERAKEVMIARGMSAAKFEEMLNRSRELVQTLNKDDSQ